MKIRERQFMDVKRKSGITSRIAMCHDCEWRNESQSYASRAARSHTTRTGHTTTVEVGRFTRYSK
jgi:hypothetical protein